MPDIALCGNECNLKSCSRNPVGYEIPPWQDFMYFEGTAACLKTRKRLQEEGEPPED